MRLTCEKCDSIHRLIEVMTIGSYEREVHECRKCGHVLMDEPKSTVIFRLELEKPLSRSFATK